MTEGISQQGAGLLTYLRRLIAGNNAREVDVSVISERTQSYAVSVGVMWQFRSDVSAQSVAGMSPIRGAHYGYDADSFDTNISRLCREAVHRMDIRERFMRRIDGAGVDGLDLSCSRQPVHDFGSYSKFRDCSTCEGGGTVRCGRCSGTGRHICTGCGGGGTVLQMQTSTRWNGRYNETYSHSTYVTCSSCWGGGTTRCNGCAGSGDLTCNPCKGHGCFTDISNVQSIAKPTWLVPKLTGLAGDALSAALQRRGPSGAHALVALTPAGTHYNDETDWVVRYKGMAEVVELDVVVKKSQHTVAAVGKSIIPISRPPIFDQLLGNELSTIRGLSTSNGQPQLGKRRSSSLFHHYRSLPAMDRALHRVAKLKGSDRAHPEAAVSIATDGFISQGAAKAIGTTIIGIINKVSPAYSVAAWSLIALPVAGVAFFLTANEFLKVSTAGIWSTLFVLTVCAALSAFAMLIASPLAWVSSALTSALLRLRVPKDYRQRGRNWEPLRKTLLGVTGAALLGAGYGSAASFHLTPPLAEVLAPAVTYAASLVPNNAFATAVLSSSPNRASGHTAVVSGPELYKEIQARLILTGYLHGKADGVMGPSTRAAIARYERSNNLSLGTSLTDLLAHMRKMRETSN